MTNKEAIKNALLGRAEKEASEREIVETLIEAMMGTGPFAKEAAEGDFGAGTDALRRALATLWWNYKGNEGKDSRSFGEKLKGALQRILNAFVGTEYGEGAGQYGQAFRRNLGAAVGSYGSSVGDWIKEMIYGGAKSPAKGGTPRANPKDPETPPRRGSPSLDAGIGEMAVDVPDTSIQALSNMNPGGETSASGMRPDTRFSSALDSVMDAVRRERLKKRRAARAQTRKRVPSWGEIGSDFGEVASELGGTLRGYPDQLYEGATNRVGEAIYGADMSARETIHDADMGARERIGGIIKSLGKRRGEK